MLALLLGGIVCWAAYLVAQGKYYTPRSDAGFYLGVIGTLVMVALFAYPLRKHVRLFHRWGQLKHWFRVHMWLGILGPLLILFHSTFHIRSTNGAVALFSMLFVVASGIVGRFVYTQIHYGLYGRRATLERLQQEFQLHRSEANPQFHIAPRVEQWIHRFERHALGQDRSLLLNASAFVGLGLRRRWVTFRCTRELHRIGRLDPSPRTRKAASEAVPLIPSYLREVQQVAQFSAYEQLFSLWHVLHVPLIYLLAASTAFHILAAYMY
jgi:hypothetical protein